GREDGGWSGEAALAAALDLERVVVVGNVGASAGDDGLQGVSGVALLAPLGRWVPHVEGRVASEGIAGAVGLRWHPIDAVEIGVAGRGHREGEKVRASVGVLLVFELGGEDA
ncbi:MAG: hypothetical protein KC656_25065, partial [Myxococcales bacterium]|nr:hypothetical protein [Myxococcales bacterium]